MDSFRGVGIAGLARSGAKRVLPAAADERRLEVTSLQEIIGQGLCIHPLTLEYRLLHPVDQRSAGATVHGRNNFV